MRSDSNEERGALEDSDDDSISNSISTDSVHSFDSISDSISNSNSRKKLNLEKYKY
jgi:hypothetical protein